MGYHRSREEKRRLRKLYEQTKNWYGSGAYYSTRKKRIVRYMIRPFKGKYWRRVSNRRVRKYEGVLNGGEYRKVFDYNYTMY